MKSKFICLVALATIAGSSGAVNAAVFNASPLRRTDTTIFAGDFLAGSSVSTPVTFATASGGRPGEEADVMKKSSSKKSSSKKSSSKKSSSKAS